MQPGNSFPMQKDIYLYYVVRSMETATTTVTRKYQITIPKKVRKKLGVRIGDKLKIKEEGDRIVIEAEARVANPVEHMWSLSKKPGEIDAVALIRKTRRRIIK